METPLKEAYIFQKYYHESVFNNFFSILEKLLNIKIINLLLYFKLLIDLSDHI